MHAVQTCTSGIHCYRSPKYEHQILQLAIPAQDAEMIDVLMSCLHTTMSGTLQCAQLSEICAWTSSTTYHVCLQARNYTSIVPSHLSVLPPCCKHPSALSWQWNTDNMTSTRSTVNAVVRLPCAMWPHGPESQSVLMHSPVLLICTAGQSATAHMVYKRDNRCDQHTAHARAGLPRWHEKAQH